MSPPGFRVRLRIRFDSALTLGPGKADLLDAIRETGSISAAARSLGMAYRRAWELVDEVNALLGTEAVERTAGGRAGGGARLTPFGVRLVARFRAMEHRTQAIVAAELAKLGAGSGPRKRARRPRRGKRTAL